MTTNDPDLAYFADRALQEAIRAIDAEPGAPRRAHEELVRAYSERVIGVLHVPSPRGVMPRHDKHDR